MSIPSNLSEREDVAAMTLRAFKEQVSKTICDIVVCEMKEKAANLTVEDLAGLKDVLFEKLQAEAPLLYKYVWQENSIALESLRTLGEGCSYAVVAGDVSLLSHTLILVIMKCVAPGKACHGLIFGTLISKVVRCMLNKHTQKLNVEAPTSEELDGVSDMLTAIWQVIAIARGGINSNPKDIRSLAASVFDGIGSVGNKTRSLMLFFSNICACVYKIYVMISDKVFGVKVGASILYRDKAVLQLWAKEVGILTSPENEYNIMNNPKWFARLATASHVGDYFAVEMTKAGCKDIPATFAPLKKRINDEYQRALNLGVATAFRPEAVGLYCFGPPGLGKTRDKDEIVQALLETMGIEQTGNDVFVLSEGMKHWTGCDGKKVLYMDDFLVVETQTTGETIGLLMHAISDARLTPPQAAIEDKGRAFAPALVYINSNHRMPTPVCLHEHEAFYRRRHICWEVDRSQEFKAAGFRNLESTGAIDWVKANSTPDNSRPHAIYRFYDTLTGSSSSGWMRFESFLEMMRERVLKKYLDNVIQYEKKLSNCKVACSKDVDSPLTMHLQRIHLAVDELAGSSNREARKIWEVPLQHAEEAATYVRDWVTQFFGSKMDVEAAKCIHSPLYYLPIRMEDGKAYWEAGPFRRQEVEIKFCEPECDLKKAYYVERMCTFYRERGCPDKAEWFMSKTLGPAKPVPTLSGSAEDFVESVQREANLTRPVWPTNARYAAIGLACLAGAFGTWHVMKYMFGGRLTSDDSEVVSYKHVTPEIAKPSPESVITTPVVRKETEVISSGDIKTSNKQSHHGIARKTTEALETESYSDFVRLIDRNMCYLVLNGIDRASGMEIKNFTMRIFGICGTWIVVQSHYIAKINRTINRTVKFVNYCATVSRPILLEKCETKNFVDSELSLLRLPVDIPQFRDIRPHIMTEQDSERISTRANIFEKELGREGITYPVVIKIMKGVEYYDGDVPFKIPAAFTYKWQAPGRCMSPLIGNLGAGNKLIGFHFCGGQGDGCAEPIVKESFEFMRNVLQVQAPNTEWLDANKSTPITLSGDLIPLGVVSSKYAVRPAERSTIVPSLIQGYVPPVTRPAPLTPNDVGGLFSPLVTGCNKHGLPPTGFRPDLITRAQKHLQEQYDLLCKPVRTTVGVLSRTEAILGIPSLSGYKGMEMSTSEGFPFTTNRPSTASNKRWLFNMETDAGEVKLISIDPMLEHVLDAKDRLRERGEIPCTVFTDCLKDARISNEAFRKPGKTRIFSISPADFTIQFRQYFLDILAAQQTHRFNMQHMVGMNVHSLEWTALARRLQTKGPSIMCGDYSNFGPGLDSEIVQRVGEVWTNWYTKYETEMGVVEEEREKRARIRKIMFEEMRHSVHLCKDILYRVCCGSPSGAPPTVNINNDVNKMYIYIAWLALSEGQNPIYNNFVSFKEHIEFFVYGDDIILNVSDEVKVWFNNETLSNFFAKHGIRYTDDTKGDTIKKYGTLSEATFLKGSFIQHRSRPMCFNYGLATKSIEDCANWCHYSPDLADATQQAIFDSLMLAYGQGEEYFNAHRQRLLNAWADAQQEPLTLYTYMDMDEMRYGYSLDYETLPIEQLVEKEREWRDAFKRAKEMARDITPLMVESGNPYSPTYQKLDKASVERLIRLTKRINKAGGKVEKHISDLYTLLKYGSE